MGDQTEKSYTWVLNDFSSLNDVRIYSLPFFCGGYSWRLLAYPKGNMNSGLGLYLELADPASLPPQLSREVRFSLTLVTKALGKPNIVLGAQCFFDTKDHNHWGYREFVSLTKLHDKDEGFLVDDKLVIVADLLFFPDPVAPQDLLLPRALIAPKDLLNFPPKETVKIGESLRSKEASCPREQKTENASKESLDDDDGHDDTSEESSDDEDDDTSEESSDDDDNDEDSSSSVSDDAAREVKSASFGDTAIGIRPSNQMMRTNYMNELVNFLDKVVKLPGKFPEDDMSNALDTLLDMIHHSLKLDSVKKMLNENSDPDGVIKNFNALLVIGICECLSKKKLEASVKSEKDGVESNNLLNESSSAKETVDVNGFQVLPSQVESIRRIFEKHPDFALEFRGKNQHLRKAYMSFLLSLIETLCQSLEELSTEDLVEADIALAYLKDAGFKVDWLEKKLEQVVEKKEKEESGLAKLKETEENLLKLKQKCAELDALGEAQKAELSATRNPLSFDDLLFG